MHPRNLFIHLFANCSSDLYNAIDTHDVVEAVKVAERNLDNFNILQEFCIINKKSTHKSTEMREIGNKHYRAENNRDALICYNKAIAYASPGTVEMLLAVSNRSAVLFNMKSVLGCISDINICFSMGCRPNLAVRLEKRMHNTRIHLQSDIGRNIYLSQNFIHSYFEKQLLKESNKNVSCATADVAFSNKGGVISIKASKKIMPGTVVAFEPAFVTAKNTEYNYLNCYYCNKFALNLMPCKGCCYALFCSDVCAVQCGTDYHNIECQIVDMLERVYTDKISQMVTQASIKLSLKLGWERTISESENIGSSRMKDASLRETFDVENPLSMLNFYDDSNFVEGRMYNGSIVCAIILKQLDRVSNYYPKDKTKRKASRRAMSKIMLHLYVYFTNNLYISYSTYNYKSESLILDGEPEFIGWFSMASKLKHSCEPNLLPVGFNDRIALLSLKTISEGEELTISFAKPYYIYNDKISTVEAPRRGFRLFMTTNKMCLSSCKICMEDWDSNSVEEITMTDKQRELYNIFRKSATDEEIFMLTLKMLDIFPINSKQYVEAHKQLMSMICVYQYTKTRNCSYR